MVQFWRKQQFYQDILEKLNVLEEKSLLCELLPMPLYTEEQILCEVLSVTDKYINDQIAKERMRTADYREYIELWVHEIKTPIAAARLVLENRQSDVGNRVIDEIDKVEGFVQQVLFYTRAANVEKDYILRETMLSELVERVVKENARRLITAHIKVEMKALDKVVVCDTKWAEFVIRQIMDNSIKYKKDPACLSFSAEEKEGSVLLCIRDNGIGISEKDIKRVFEKGFTGENGRNYQKSTGMGLYLCRKLCDKMGLSIAVESKGGTSVKIVFPKRSPIPGE